MRSGPLRLVTISFSRTVVTVLEAVAATRQLRVSCSESRPALEGTAAGVAARRGRRRGHVLQRCGHRPALGGADGVVLGADAVAPEWFLNKAGTRMLAAAAAQQGVPVQVMATRDKFVSHAVGGRLAMREGAAGRDLGIAARLA